MENDRISLNTQEISFDELLQEIDEPTPTEIVAAAVYYLKVVEEVHGWIRQQQIKEILGDSEHLDAKVAIDHVHSVVRNLDDFGYLRYTPSGGVKISASGSMWFKSLLRGEQSYGFFSEEWSDFSDSPFADLRREIEECYHAGAHTAVVVLSRKLIENLLIELLRMQYGLETDADRELFYDTDRKRFQPLAVLIENFENNLHDFRPFSEKIDEGTVQKLNDIRETGNAGAHSVETGMSSDELATFRGDMNEVIEDLDKVRQKLLSVE